MLDLDEFLDSSDTRTFKVTIGASYLTGNLSITEHRMLSEWFGAYNYILPDKRSIFEPLYLLITGTLSRPDSKSIFDMACRLEHVSVIYSELEQQDIYLQIASKKVATLPG